MTTVNSLISEIKRTHPFDIHIVYKASEALVCYYSGSVIPCPYKIVKCTYSQAVSFHEFCKKHRDTITYHVYDDSHDEFELHPENPYPLISEL